VHIETLKIFCDVARLRSFSRSAEVHVTKGITAMATKTSAENAINQAVKFYGYKVEDLTIHTFFGVPTWQGELVRPAVNNEGEEYGSLYAGMVMLHANADHQPQHVQWGFDKFEAFNKYEHHLIRSRTQQVGSNVAEIKEVKGAVESVRTVVVNGTQSFLINLVGRTVAFVVEIDHLGDPTTEDVLSVKVGELVYIKYADIYSSKTMLVMDFRKVNPGVPESTHPPVQ
jgi:hypothetical protein